ncbi:DUF1993 domain-containing protein [Pseudomarimonas salicorniae]|uniref:DUF1993 domain-containing protein n=1 Tax=Pseudomarimonas salicorniae TaxID=2933270 RepID=A0ABT0GKD6_9GAMM|nr:DUF1993 domain-containing protein [Lysobacter sp. CAU 1642]MCK7594996.1 DUF1993 domain-containing protein [Lysobacter sp. CAU 1642]
MSLSIYETTVNTFRRMLGGLDKELQRAVEYAATRGFEPDRLLSGRLAPDMFDLTRQVQIACDLAKGAGARLAGLDIPKHADDETQIAALRARIARVLSFLDTLPREDIDGAAEREIVLSVQGRELRFAGADYVNRWALPNFYFHCSMAYALLRQQGVPLGKRDFLALG